MKTMNKKLLALLGAIVVAAAGAYYHFADRHIGADPAVKVQIPDLSRQAQAGHNLFKNKCASCHGAKADGTPNGPPLIHKIYHPGHHGDFSFYRAAKQGVRAHHWPFGNMAPVPNISDDEIEQIVRFVRETQKANGVF